MVVRRYCTSTSVLLNCLKFVYIMLCHSKVTVPNVAYQLQLVMVLMILMYI
jgi:hypothetical protein